MFTLKLEGHGHRLAHANSPRCQTHNVNSKLFYAQCIFPDPVYQKTKEVLRVATRELVIVSVLEGTDQYLDLGILENRELCIAKILRIVECVI